LQNFAIFSCLTTLINASFLNYPSMLPLGITKSGLDIGLLPQMANRHGLIAGATGTGKTVTLQTLTEAFSRAGVPVFTADIKGDLSGLAKAGMRSEKISQRLALKAGLIWEPRANPIQFWDLFGKTGTPVRTTVSEMGALLLARVLDLNETQSQVLQLAFQIADAEGLLLLDLKDLKELLTWIGENSKEFKTEYGNMSPQTLGSIQRNLLNLEAGGGKQFFGEPALNIAHLMQKDFSGQGAISILDATTLQNDARLYSTFLLWMLSELFEELPEVGDQKLPKLVFFFDEAHLLFKNAPNSLIEKIEQLVRLIRSKGVGVYFVTQNPLDIPETVLGQLGTRIQHALRAFTPADQKALKSAAQTFRANPAFKTDELITQLGVGEALVSVLDTEGRPTMVEHTIILPPQSQIGPITEVERAEILLRSPVHSQYAGVVDRESAFEKLRARRTTASTSTTEQASQNPPGGIGGILGGIFQSTSKRQGVGEALAKSVARSVGSQIGRQIVRGILGTIFAGTTRR
jgi:DNA helicase HerA-like ATPase